MADSISHSARILRSDGKPWLTSHGQQAYSKVPDPAPAAFLGWVTVREDQDESVSKLSAYVRLPGDPLTYRQAYSPGSTLMVGGSPKCSNCKRTGKQINGLYVPSLAEAGKVSPEDERLCEDCYRVHMQKERKSR